MFAIHTPYSKNTIAACLAISAFLVTWAPDVHADELSAIKDLQVSGKIQEALAKVNQELNARPKDAQLRFLKGVILADSGRASEAITIFQRLTEDNPRMPEPYNNLAVLYASTGQFDKAKQALEAAIRTNPSYATAHENLGDIYARMAAEAYGKALQLDVSKTQVPPKLAMIRDLVGTSPVVAGKPGTTTALAAPSPSPLPAAVAPPPPFNKPVSPGVSGSTLPTTKPVASAPVGKPPEPTKTVAAADLKQVEAAVGNWAAAWSARDVPGYLAAYTPDFIPASGGGRKAWEEDRKMKILGKSKISVKISAIVISVDGNSASARFRQDYNADALQTSTRKTLGFVKRGNRWLISKEVSG